MKAFLAPWILPVSSPPISNGAIAVDDQGEIIFVGSQSRLPKCDSNEEFADHAILPGLVNAHTHLEFSDLKTPLGNPGMPFTQWIAEVLALRSGQSQTENAKQVAIELGIQECLDHGTAAIGEIATPPVSTAHYLNADRCSLTVFQEALGADQNDYERKLSEINYACDQLKDRAIAVAISPHAPYSVPPILLNGLLDLAKENGSAVAMHLAETMEEREFVEHRSGPFVKMLEQFGVWQPDMYAAEDSILNILKTLSQAKRALVIHGNYLSSEELNFIATVKERMSIVFCPRTHRYFQHSKYPIDAMLERGINLAVGTDSRASNPDLNLLNELKEIRNQFPQISPATILEMGTRNGAKALGLEDQLGTLQEGRAGRFCFAKLQNRKDAYSWL